MRIPKLIQAEISLALISILWGSTFTIVKKGLEQISPILFVALRFWIAAVVAGVFMSGQYRKIKGKTVAQGVLLSVALSSGFLLQTMGLRDTTPSNSAFITSLCVLLVPVLGFLIYPHKPSYRTVSGILLATLGLILLLADSFDFGMHSGDFLTLICAFMFGFHILYLGRFVLVSNYRHLIFVKMVSGGILCSIMVPVVESPRVFWDFYIVIYLLILGVLATAVAFLVQGWAQQYSDPTHTALIFTLEPIFATVFAYLFLDQGLGPREWIGGLLILAGILVAEIRGKEKRRTDIGGSIPV